jgi:hypothetical protein
MIIIGYRIIKIVFSGRKPHLLCWTFTINIYGKLGWGFVGRSDISFNVKIEKNIVRSIRSKKRNEV